MREIVLFGGKYKAYDELLKFIMEKDEQFRNTFIFATTMLPLEEVKLLSKGKINNLDSSNFDIDFHASDDILDLGYSINHENNDYNISINMNLPSFNDCNENNLTTIQIDNITLDESYKIQVSLEKVNTKDALVIHTNKLKEGKSNSVSFKKIFFDSKELPMNSKKR